MARFRRTLIRKTRTSITDVRDPMLRLLEDGQCHFQGKVHIYVCYHEQWRTLTKAQRLGYVTDDSEQLLTDAGRAFIAAKRAA